MDIPSEISEARSNNISNGDALMFLKLIYGIIKVARHWFKASVNMNALTVGFK